MKRIVKFIKDNYQYILFVLMLIVVNLFLTYLLQINNTNNKIYFIVMTIINIILISIYSYIIFKFKNIKIEKLYLIMIIPIGVLYLIAFPLNTIPDENTHFLRIYEISSGHLISTSGENGQGRYFDSSIYKSVISAKTYKDTLKKLTVKNTGDKSFYTFANTALYSFVCYIPQSIGVVFAKILHLPILMQAYMARLFNFLVFVFLTYLAIKLIPYKKTSILMIMFFPLVIQEAVSLAPDALTIATTAFLISYVFHLRENKEKQITKKEIVVLAATSIVLSLCKIVYLPICLIIFLIPKEKFTSLKKKNMIVLSIAAIAVIINLIWLSISSGFLPDTSGIDSGRQLKYIFSNIPEYVMILFRTYSTYIKELFFNSFGTSLGTFCVPISTGYILVLVIIFIMSVVFDNDNKKKTKLNIIEKTFLILIIFGTIMLISTSLYLQWTDVAATMVRGIQGRYFVPLYFILPLIFTKYKITPKVDFMNKYVLIFLVALNIYAVTAIFYHFI